MRQKAAGPSQTNTPSGECNNWTCDQSRQHAWSALISPDWGDHSAINKAYATYMSLKKTINPCHRRAHHQGLTLHLLGLSLFRNPLLGPQTWHRYFLRVHSCNFLLHHKDCNDWGHHQTRECPGYSKSPNIHHILFPPAREFLCTLLFHSKRKPALLCNRGNKPQQLSSHKTCRNLS
jgi:hypothetical protein